MKKFFVIASFLFFIFTGCDGVDPYFSLGDKFTMDWDGVQTWVDYVNEDKTIVTAGLSTIYTTGDVFQFGADTLEIRGALPMEMQENNLVLMDFFGTPNPATYEPEQITFIPDEYAIVYSEFGHLSPTMTITEGIIAPNDNDIMEWSMVYENDYDQSFPSTFETLEIRRVYTFSATHLP